MKDDALVISSSAVGPRHAIDWSCGLRAIPPNFHALPIATASSLALSRPEPISMWRRPGAANFGLTSSVLLMLSSKVVRGPSNSDRRVEGAIAWPHAPQEKWHDYISRLHEAVTRETPINAF
jgi:hypothetical protein